MSAAPLLETDEASLTFEECQNGLEAQGTPRNGGILRVVHTCT